MRTPAGSDIAPMAVPRLASPSRRLGPLTASPISPPSCWRCRPANSPRARLPLTLQIFTDFSHAGPFHGEGGSARPALSIRLIGGLDREPVSHLQRPPLEQDGDGAEDRLIAVCYSDSYRRLAGPLEDDGERIGFLRHACYPTKPASGPNEITAVATRLRAVHSCISKLRCKFQSIKGAAVQGMAGTSGGRSYGGIVNKQGPPRCCHVPFGLCPGASPLGRSRERRNSVLWSDRNRSGIHRRACPSHSVLPDGRTVYRKLTGAKPN
jgi:hypothetical protein